MTGTIHPVLIALPVLIGCLSAFVALEYAARGRMARGRERTVWLGAGAVVLGLGIWSLHFIGMLSFRLSTGRDRLPVSYDMQTIAAAVVVGVLASAVALSLVRREKPTTGRILGAGVCGGAAVLATHYISAAALRAGADVAYAWPLVGGSIALAVSGGVSAFLVAFRAYPIERARARRRIGAALLLGIAAALTHHTAMSALRFTLTGVPGRLESRFVLATDGVAAIVATAISILLAVALTAAWLDRRAKHRLHMAEEYARLYHEADAARRVAQESEQRFRALADSAPVLIWMADPDGTYTYFNRPWLDFTGRTMPEELGMACGDRVHLDDVEMCLEAYRASFADRARLRAEYRLRRADGEYRWVLDTGVPRYDHFGEFVGYIGSCVDITERRLGESERERMASELAQRAGTLEAVVTVAPVGIGVAYDKECRDLYINPTLAALRGVTALLGDVPARPANDVSLSFRAVRGRREIPPADLPMQRAARDGVTVSNEEIDIVTPEGGVVNLLCYASPLLDENGRPRGSVGAFVDISPRKRDERRLRQSEERFRSLVSATTQIVWTANAQGELLEDVPKWREITGQQPEEAPGLGWVNAIHPADQEHVRRAWRDAVTNRMPFDAEYRLGIAAGGYRWFATRAVPVFEANGEVREWVGTTTDIHYRRTADEADAFLLEAARVLSTSLELDETLEQVMRLVVPRLADYALVYLKRPTGDYYQATSAHVDPEKAPLLVKLGQVYRPDLRNPNSPLARVLSSMQPVFGRAMSPETVQTFFDSESVGIYSQLDPVSYIIVPLVAHGELLGSLVLVSSVSGRSYSSDDLALAELTGARAALAIENARLYREAHEARDRAVRAAQLESQLVRARLEALRAQLHPHFLFNSLNTIAMLVRRDAKQNALRAVVSLSELLRRVLASRETFEVSLHEELTLVEHYLELERLRFRDRLNIHVDAPPETRNARVPSLLLQPLVENAVKHGVAHRDGPGCVAIAARREDERLLLRVQDNGPGFPSSWDPASDSGVGLANTRERLDRMYPGSYRLQLGNAPEGGALAVVEIPFSTGDQATPMHQHAEV